VAIEPGQTGAMFRALGRALPKPRAIVVVSAHHATEVPELGAAAQPATIHDFGGFPDALYTLRYPSQGSVELAERVAALLERAGIAATINPRRGLDHGIWVPLMHMYPDADVPVVPLSMQPRRDAAHHYGVGRALAVLRHEGILVLASGNLTHNLYEVNMRGADASAERYVTEHQHWFAEKLAARDVPALLDWQRQAPHAQRAHPTDEHLLPIFVALGAGGEAASAVRLHEAVTYRVLAMDAYAFDEDARGLAGLSAAAHAITQ
jgi:4,5-DOPA dioxygenase extradiol